MKHKIFIFKIIFLVTGLLLIFGSWKPFPNNYSDSCEAGFSFNSASKGPAQLACSTGEIIGFYTDIFSGNPTSIDVVDFPKMHGGPIVLSNPLASLSYNVQAILRPTNNSSIDPSGTELICVVSEEGLLLRYDDGPCTLLPINLSPAKTTAPVHLNGQVYAIDVGNNGIATGTPINIELAVLDIPNGQFSGLGLFTFNANPPYFFTHESMSSATNGVDELYFISGSFLIIFSSVNTASPNFCMIDLDPNRQYGYYGLEYLEPGKLLAIQNDYSSVGSAVDLVEIDFDCLASTPSASITTIYDIQNKLSPPMVGNIFSIDYYSTTIDTCNQLYYLSTLYNNSSQSRLVEINLKLQTHVQQILPKFLFGIECKPAPCDISSCCRNYDDFLNTATNIQTNGELGDCKVHFNTMGLDSCMKITYFWGDGTPSEGPYGNNVAVWHNFQSSNTYTICFLIVEYDQGVPCWEYQFCEDVQVICDNCCESGDTVIMNGSFTGLPPGDLISHSTDWYGALKTPQASNSDGCSMPGMVQMWGNSQVGEILVQTNPNGMFKEGWTYQIRFCAKFLNINNLPNNLAHGWFRLQAGNAPSVINGLTIVPGAQMGISQTLVHEDLWENVCLEQWTAPADFNAIYINFENISTYPDADSTSFGRIDDLCIEIVSTTAVKEQVEKRSIQVYPIPSIGLINIESEIPFLKGQIQIFDFLGRVIYSKAIMSQSVKQTITLNDYIDGLYFLTIIEDGKPIYIQKILLHGN